MDKQNFDTLLQQTEMRKQGKISSYLLTISPSGTGPRKIQITAKPLRDPSGRYIGAFATIKEGIQGGEKELLMENEQEQDSPSPNYLTICAHCKSIFEDEEKWVVLEEYLLKHFHITFSHGLCYQCLNSLYPGFKK